MPEPVCVCGGEGILIEISAMRNQNKQKKYVPQKVPCFGFEQLVPIVQADLSVMYKSEDITKGPLVSIPVHACF